MRHLKTLGVTLAAAFALGVMALGATAPSAVALPDVSILSGETFPLDMSFADNNETAVVLETANGLLTGRGVLLLLDLTSLSALGAFDVVFLNIAEAGGSTNKCHTEGDAAGETLITGEWHLVPVTETPTLTNGIALSLTHLVLMTCSGGFVFDFKGCLLASSNATENGVDLTETKGALGTDEKGKNLQKEYLNDSKAKVKCVLTEEIVGTKKTVEAALGVNEGKSITLGIESGSLAKMFEFSGL